MTKKVFVSGSFDLLHSGHITFLQQAAAYGDLYVAVGSDKTIYDLKGRVPVNNEQERLFMMQSVACVKAAFISSGSGMLDFIEEFNAIKPDVFVVNEDGNVPQKRALCQAAGVEYMVLKREPYPGLKARSTTALRRVELMPYRLDLAGGWLDQPFVSQLYPGPVITVSIVPTVAFNERSGMATSTRRAAIDLWGNRIPTGDPQKLAKLLFCYDNPPGTQEISGSQDALGIIMPGLNKLHYEGEYWPAHIETLLEELTLQFVENVLYLVPLGPREAGYNPLETRHITPGNAQKLAEAAENCWHAILKHDVRQFGQAMRAAFEAQVAMFPNMSNPMIVELIGQYANTALGWKLSGAGGGGYLVLVADKPVSDALQLRIRRGE